MTYLIAYLLGILTMLIAYIIAGWRSLAATQRHQATVKPVRFIDHDTLHDIGRCVPACSGWEGQRA